MPSGSEITFRRAVDDDWPEIWQIFRRVVATGDTYMYDPEIGEADAQATWLHVGDGRRATFVAESGDRIVGTALLAPNFPGLGDHVANAGWMVDPELVGRGIGRAFAIAVIDEARRLGFEAMQFNAVVATNDRAVALWQSLGFHIAGTLTGAFRHAVDGRTDVHVMYRTL